MPSRPLFAVWRGLRSPRLLHWLLIYFMVLLVAGTFAQKSLGVFTATHLFFNSFVYWLGPVPLPAGAAILGLLFVNLAAHFITRSDWHRPQLGVTLAHLSVLILLLGGAVTLATKTEGFVLMRRNETVQEVYDYHDRELQVIHAGAVVFRAARGQLKRDQVLRGAALPFHIRIERNCANCRLDDQGRLIPVGDTEDETSQFGLALAIDTGDGQLRRMATTEFDDAPHILTFGRETYRIVLQRRRYRLPFALLLENFSQRYYLNTDIAQGYASALSITENGRHWPVLIAMNAPFRYKGYTFYQSSVLTLPDGETASVLNVVHNAGWLFPYAATALLLVGLGLHVGGRYGRR